MEFSLILVPAVRDGEPEPFDTLKADTSTLTLHSNRGKLT